MRGQQQGTGSAGFRRNLPALFLTQDAVSHETYSRYEALQQELRVPTLTKLVGLKLGKIDFSIG